jgi:tripartite-type tricarboxylate transporter receptor subunit TctC
MPYDPVKDFSPITLIELSASVVVVHPSVPVRSVKELIAWAKARPGELNYASTGVGGATHLAVELFKFQAGVDIVLVLYKGTGPAVNDLIGGHVQLMFASLTGVMPHVKSGRLRALAVTSAEPTALASGLPTVAASGLPGYRSEAIAAVFAPAKTPAMIIKRLNHEIIRVLNQPDVKQRFFETGVGIIGSSPEQLAATVNSQIATMGKLIKDIGIETK